MSETSSEIQTRLQFAIEAAKGAGKLTLRYFQNADVGFERKSDDSPVTIADQEAEQLLRKGIQQQFPDDAIVGEEFGEQEGTSGYTWILDPIDGTKSFISGVPLYGTLIGVTHQQQSVIGVIYVPGLDECVYAAKNCGAWYTKLDSPPIPAQVSSRNDLNDCLFLTSQVDPFDDRGAAEAYKEMEAKAYITRTWGDCYGYLLIATGRAEIMIDAEMSVWDAAALQPIMEEAGGTFTDWSGKPTIYSGEGIGTNGKVLDQVLAITKRFAKSQ